MANTKKYWSILILNASKTGCSFLRWQSHLDTLYDQDRHCKILTKKQNHSVLMCQILRFAISIRPRRDLYNLYFAKGGYVQRVHVEVD